MPTVYKRKDSSGRGNWSEESLQMAVKAVHDGRSGVNAAAKHFGIPVTTLKRRLKSKDVTKRSLGPPSVLGEDNERKLVQLVQKLQDQGFDPCGDDLRFMAFELAESQQISHKFNRIKKQAGYDWLQSFLARHPSVTLGKMEKS